MPCFRPTVAFVLLLGWSSASWAGESVDYVRDIKPLFAQHCNSCHGGKMQKGRLRLDTAALMRKGGSSGPAIVPEKAKESLLIDALRGTNDVTPMPFKKQPLPE